MYVVTVRSRSHDGGTQGVMGIVHGGAAATPTRDGLAGSRRGAQVGSQGQGSGTHGRGISWSQRAPRRHLRCPSPRMVGTWVSCIQPFIYYLALHGTRVDENSLALCPWYAMVLQTVDKPFLLLERTHRSLRRGGEKSEYYLGTYLPIYSAVPARAEVMPPWRKLTVSQSLTHSPSSAWAKGEEGRRGLAWVPDVLLTSFKVVQVFS